MQRQGIPRPLFRVQDKLAKIVKGQYEKLIRELLHDVKTEMRNNGMTIDSAPIDGDEDETLENLIEFFTKKGEELKKESEEIANRMRAGSAENTLQHKWMDESKGPEISETAKKQITGLFKKEQKDYLARLMNDSTRLKAAFTLDKEQIFNQHYEELYRLYLDNTLQRIGWEQDYIKRLMLQRIAAYVDGTAARLEFDDLIKMAYTAGDNLSRLFARDQMQRFNKAVTISTFNDAGVTKVKWVTCQDGRVRNKGYIDKRGNYHRPHTELNGQIFGVKNLPIELDDYNCRCGLVPVEWED